MIRASAATVPGRCRSAVQRASDSGTVDQIGDKAHGDLLGSRHTERRSAVAHDPAAGGSPTSAQGLDGSGDEPDGQVALAGNPGLVGAGGVRELHPATVSIPDVNLQIESELPLWNTRESKIAPWD